MAVDSVVAQRTGAEAPYRVVEDALGASAARTEFENYVPGLLVIAIVMSLFTAAMAVAREVEAGTVGDHVVGLFDMLPPTHAVVALNKILSLGASFGDIAWELGWLSVLSILYFGAGVWLFQRTQLRTA